MEPTTGLEPVTSSLPRTCSTAELRGRVVLYLLDLFTHRKPEVERETGLEPATLSLEG
jgi:hypothetical protein